MQRRRSGFAYMVKMKSQSHSLNKKLPKDEPKSQSVLEIKQILKIWQYHSEEISETDEDKANRERRSGNREGSNDNNWVVKVLDKDWHSSEVKTKPISLSVSDITQTIWEILIYMINNIILGSYALFLKTI